MVAQVEGYVWMRRQRLAAAGARQRRRHAAGGGVFARCCSSRGPLFYELAELARGASYLALAIQLNSTYVGIGT